LLVNVSASAVTLTTSIPVCSVALGFSLVSPQFRCPRFGSDISDRSTYRDSDRSTCDDSDCSTCDGCKQRESPRVLRSRASLRASLTPFAAVLTSSCFPEHAAPFIPARVGQ
jgi:hypothetical protein